MRHASAVWGVRPDLAAAVRAVIPWCVLRPAGAVGFVSAGPPTVGCLLQTWGYVGRDGRSRSGFPSFRDTRLVRCLGFTIQGFRLRSFHARAPPSRPVLRCRWEHRVWAQGKDVFPDGSTPFLFRLERKSFPSGDDSGRPARRQRGRVGAADVSEPAARRAHALPGGGQHPLRAPQTGALGLRSPLSLPVSVP